MAQTIRIFLKYFGILGNGKEDTVHLRDKLEIILTSMTNTFYVLVLQYIIFFCVHNVNACERRGPT